MKYTEIAVKPFVNVSSSCDYFVDVLYKANGEPSQPGRYFHRRFHLNSEMFLLSGNEPGYDKTMPKYVVWEVLRQLSQIITENTLKPYEYDRDGNKRWDDLKYYDDEDLKGQASKWGEKVEV